jgi:hypothetical protein
MGDVHALEGDPSAGRCVVVNRYTGERTPVSVDPNKVDILDLPTIPGACPLFRRDAGGSGVCPVHETWPAVCEEYHVLADLLVLDPGGERAARVMGQRHLAVDETRCSRPRSCRTANGSPASSTMRPGTPPSRWSSSKRDIGSSGEKATAGPGRFLRTHRRSNVLPRAGSRRARPPPPHRNGDGGDRVRKSATLGHGPVEREPGAINVDAT